MAKTIGFEAYETIAYPFVNFNLGGADGFDDARARVRAGTHRWVAGHAGCLKLVPVGYQLEPWEHLLVETQHNLFERSPA